MTYPELRNLFSAHERNTLRNHLTAGITFCSFGPDNKLKYSWPGRTYMISSDNKAFQPNRGGYSIFGSCLDGSDQYVRLDRLMREEHGGEDGWVVETCFLVGYLVIKCSNVGISDPRMFYLHDAAADYMLSQLAQLGKLDLERLKGSYYKNRTLFEEDVYGADLNSAWLADDGEDWHWKIQRVYIYEPMHMVFPGPSGYIACDSERSCAI